MLAVAALAARPVTAADNAAAPKVTVDLLSEVAAVAPGSTFWVGLRQRIAPGWHTYWSNPGDSGEPPQIEWTLPAGFTAGPIAWPRPERIRVGPAMTFGYSREVVLPIPVTAPAGLQPGSRVTLAGNASWLVCEKECIPEDAPIALALPVSAGAPPPDPAGAPPIERARRAVPVPSPWLASFAATADTVTLAIAAPGLAPERIGDVWFYPARWGAIDLAAPQDVTIDSRGLSLAVARGQLPEAVAAPIEGVLVVTERLDGGEAVQAFALRATPRGAIATPSLSLLRALALALAGGLVLNLMPCVLPVLSVKALALVRHASEARAAVRRHGLAYAAGVLGSFAVVAGTLIALRAAGEQIGWGFQLQSPIVVVLLAYLFFAMALMLSGVLTAGGRLAGAGGALASRPGYAGSFFTGALAAVAATPCTAPFMGVAMGFALTQPWQIALLVFEALAAGLALPFVLLAFAPGWRRFLPRPGPWMKRLEQWLALPLYGSVAWLLWVLSRQAGPPAVSAALAGLVLIGLAACLHRLSRGASPARRRAAAAVAGAVALGAAALAPLAGTLSAPPAARASGDGEAYSARRLEELRRRGQPVFVNVTAAWCITCVVNERTALGSPAVARAFARKGVVTLTADWTNRDAAITRMLGAFGRSGVPLYLLFPPALAGAGAGEPTVLPQILSEGAVLDAIDKL